MHYEYSLALISFTLGSDMATGGLVEGLVEGLYVRAVVYRYYSLHVF